MGPAFEGLKVKPRTNVRFHVLSNALEQMKILRIKYSNYALNIQMSLFRVNITEVMTNEITVIVNKGHGPLVAFTGTFIPTFSLEKSQ